MFHEQEKIRATIRSAPGSSSPLKVPSFFIRKTAAEKQGSGARSFEVVRVPRKKG
jgi:hypothetical protein